MLSSQWNLLACVCHRVPYLKRALEDNKSYTCKNKITHIITTTITITGESIRKQCATYSITVYTRYSLFELFCNNTNRAFQPLPLVPARPKLRALMTQEEKLEASVAIH